MAEEIQNSVIEAITGEIDEAFSNEKAVEIGMLSIKSANRTIEDASNRPDPEQLFRELWYEGEVCCLFADSNLGKSIFAVQMADEISRTRNVLYNANRKDMGTYESRGLFTGCCDSISSPFFFRRGPSVSWWMTILA